MSKRAIDKIIIHCSDSPDSLNIGFREINDWHRERGFIDKSTGINCGYHYIVRRTGRVEVGRPEHRVGSHCYGHNRKSIGICWVGRDKMTPKQDLAIKKLVRDIKSRYSINLSNIYGHYEFDDKKTCPNFNMNEFRLDILFKGLDDV
jgi:N-acetyl-anhydromuramyl-L-alanine amidase AmpD